MTENKNVLRVLNGFYELSSMEKAELINELNKVRLGDPNSININRSMVKIKLQASLGPLDSNVCKCCGKS